jgi:preprotein translocase subunit YajC
LELCVVPAYAQLLVIILAMLGFWAIVMRPARNQQKRVASLQSELQLGEEVVLSAGIFGTVRALSEGRVELEVAPGTVITVARQVVVRRVEDLEATGTTAESDQGASGGPGESDPDKAED